MWLSVCLKAITNIRYGFGMGKEMVLDVIPLCVVYDGFRGVQFFKFNMDILHMGLNHRVQKIHD